MGFWDCLNGPSIGFQAVLRSVYNALLDMLSIIYAIFYLLIRTGKI